MPLLEINKANVCVCVCVCENGITREKVLAKCSGESPFSEYLGFQIDFNVSNAWTNMWNKTMQEKDGTERHNSKKRSERSDHT